MSKPQPGDYIICLYRRHGSQGPFLVISSKEYVKRHGYRVGSYVHYDDCICFIDQNGNAQYTSSKVELADYSINCNTIKSLLGIK